MAQQEAIANTPTVEVQQTLPPIINSPQPQVVPETIPAINIPQTIPSTQPQTPVQDNIIQFTQAVGPVLNNSLDNTTNNEPIVNQNNTTQQ